MYSIDLNEFNFEDKVCVWRDDAAGTCVVDTHCHGSQAQAQAQQKKREFGSEARMQWAKRHREKGEARIV